MSYRDLSCSPQLSLLQPGSSASGLSSVTRSWMPREKQSLLPALLCVINERPCLDISHRRRGHLRPSTSNQTLDVFEAHRRGVAVRNSQLPLPPSPEPSGRVQSGYQLLPWGPLHLPLSHLLHGLLPPFPPRIMLFRPSHTYPSPACHGPCPGMIRRGPQSSLGYHFIEDTISHEGTAQSTQGLVWRPSVMDPEGCELAE